MATKSLHVGNLSNASTEATLAAAFAPYGATNVRLVPKRGFAYLDVPHDQIEPALRGMNGRRLDGHPLTVKVNAPSVVAGIDRNGKGDR